ncbi:MAG: hypothetical protein H6698_06065 [Myxococcales bacterium]|nr:hypothetical protein [Myxococcales bacterium]MCB9531903.1 hypothetical protein [Myxococcales bacterium]MCB9533871.1 hypothetical protein [Myxococcales bacterium]
MTASAGALRFTRKIRLDRPGSVTLPARLNQIVEVSPEVRAEEGAIVACRALTDNRAYGNMELPSGRLAKIVAGNLVAGALGARHALHGYMGRVPERVSVGDTLALLNMGGVIGICDSPNPDLGPPIQLEVLGQVSRGGQLLNIKDFALPPVASLGDGAPLVLVVGTCMNSGKTFAAAETIRLLSQAGQRVAAGKLSGVAAQRDLLLMLDNGAIATSSFVECGLPSTVNAPHLGDVARAVVHKLDAENADLILLELGDGIIGGYNTGSILADPDIRRRTASLVLCANDLVGAWGGVEYLSARGHRVDVISGPVTDNAVGTTYIEGELGLRSANARTQAPKLARHVADSLGLDIQIGR